MAWRASIIYAQATPRPRATLLGDYIEHLNHAWPQAIAPVAGVGPPDDLDEMAVPWDALRRASGPAI